MGDETDVIYEKNKTKKKHHTIDMSRGSTINTVWAILEAIVLVIGGVLCLVYCNDADMHTLFFILISVFLIVDGFLRIIINFLPVLTLVEKAKLTYGLVVTGAVELAIGITILCDINQNKSVLDSLLRFMSMFIGIVLIVIGAIALVYSIGFLKNKVLKLTKAAIAGFITAAVLIALGVVTIIYINNESVFATIALIVGGVVLIFMGVGEFFAAILNHKKYRLKVKVVNKINEVSQAEHNSEEDEKVDENSSNQ